MLSRVYGAAYVLIAPTLTEDHHMRTVCKGIAIDPAFQHVSSPVVRVRICTAQTTQPVSGTRC